ASILPLYPQKYNRNTRGCAARGRGGVGECVMSALRRSGARGPAVSSRPVCVSRPLRVVLLAAASSAILATIAADQARAQVLPYNIGDAVRSGEQTRRQQLPGPAQTPVLPRLVEPQFTMKDKTTLLVRHFKVESPNLVDEAEIRAALAPYEGRKLTITQIYEAADGVTTIYRNHGYLVAKAYVPAQNAAASGVLRLKVVVGQYGDVRLDNHSLVR